MLLTVVNPEEVEEPNARRLHLLGRVCDRLEFLDVTYFESCYGLHQISSSLEHLLLFCECLGLGHIGARHGLHIVFFDVRTRHRLHLFLLNGLWNACRILALLNDWVR